MHPHKGTYKKRSNRKCIAFDISFLVVSMKCVCNTYLYWTSFCHFHLRSYKIPPAQKLRRAGIHLKMLLDDQAQCRFEESCSYSCCIVISETTL